MMSMPEFMNLNHKLLRNEKKRLERKMEELIECDCCHKAISDFNEDLFHATGIIRGKLNKHIHLCYYCYHEYYTSIPVIKDREEFEGEED